MRPGGGQIKERGFMPPAGKLKLSTVARLFRLILKDNKWRIAVVLLCILVSTLATLASTLFTKTLLDDYVVPMIGQAAPDFSPLAVALVKLAVVLVIGMGASYMHSILTVYISQGTLKTLRHNLFEHMERLPLSYFDSRSHGDIMSVYTNDVDTLRQVIGQTIPRLFQSLVTVISTFVSMIVLSIPLSVISIVMAFIMYVVTRKLGNLSRKYFKKRQEMLGKVNGFIEEMVSGQRVVKVYCHEDKAMEQFSQLNEQLRQSVFNANKIGNIVMPVNGNLGNLGYVFIATAGAAIALASLTGWYFCGLNGSVLTLGTLVAFLTLHKNFTRPVTQISNEINSIVMASAGSDRVYDLMDQKQEENRGKVTLEKTGDCQWCWKTPEGERTPLKGEVSLSDVDFSYVEGKQVLFDINLTAYPGQKIAFVGGTGAGKTTITNLINRFYEIQDGKITYDGLDIKDIEKDSLRRSLGIVLQETHLFTGRVIDNIRYGRLDATDQECIEAARLVCAHNFIRRLPFGYDTVIDGDGENLSQGERQLLAIARAAVAAPPVLILDEATSSIDTRTEKLIQQGMDQLMKGRTTFVIAHRLSTILNSDYIMVMDHGRIIERGKHNELLALKGKYYELFTGNQIV
ncbi:MAG: ABC transporter ATP-binding protein [Bacteroidales bacterium]|nr:ABC transporter ATP-binding protein [Bacteroidales bacterium]